MATKDEVERFLLNCPFTGGNATLKKEKSVLTYRKEKWAYMHLYYECDDTKECFTTEHLDELNIGQVYNQYRAKYGIPFVDEIAKIRKMYNLSAVKMSRILGFGDNQYRLYENGDMPSETNGKILMSIKNPLVFKTFLENSKNQFSEDEFTKMVDKMNSLHLYSDDDRNMKMVFQELRRDLYNGFALQSVDHVRNMMLYFINRMNGVWTTMMNKLLFYTDFYSYKLRGVAMSGLSYRAIQRGPVPVRWERVYSFYDDIEQDLIHIADGVDGQKLCSNSKYDPSEFSEEEMKILNAVYERFHKMSASQASDLSHAEDVWQKYKDTRKFLDFNMAFNLKGL